MKRKISILIIFLLLIIITYTVIYNNSNLKITSYTYTSSRLPESFNNYVICHISDLHNKSFGDNQEKLINKVEEINPNIIVITGDLIDSKNYDLDIALNFINEATKIVPIYYVSGNHEATSGKYNEIKKELTKRNVIVLDNDYSIVENKNDRIAILGLSDSSFLPSEVEDQTKYYLNDIIKQIDETIEFKILLAHRPETFTTYVEHDINLVFSGHTHGGQIRIPFIGGIVAPNQGLFPKYDSGKFKESNTTMYISNGLGNSIIPIRINNNPEIIKITLKNK